jgi:hypothetical protein
MRFEVLTMIKMSLVSGYHLQDHKQEDHSPQYKHTADLAISKYKRVRDTGQYSGCPRFKSHLKTGYPV